MYFILPEVTENGLEGNLYRFNTESGKIECLKKLGKITDYALVGDAALYKK